MDRPSGSVGVNLQRGLSAATHLGISLLCEAALYVALAVLTHRAASWSWIWSAVLACGLFVFVRFVLVLLTFAYAWVTQRGWHLSPASWLRMVVVEFCALLRYEWLILTWRKTPSTPPVALKPLVIFIHGIYCNGGIWQPVIRKLQEQACCEVRTVDLEPVTGSIDAQTQTLADWLDAALPAAATPRIVLVAHSLGGLVARNYLRQYRNATRIHALICIATPHAGSRLAYLVPTDTGRDLRPGSAALRALAGSVSDIDVRCIRTCHDNLVVPAESAQLPGTHCIALRGIGHLSIIDAPAVLTEIVRALR